MKITLTSVFVDDQDKALKFYTEVLGFVKKQDFPVGKFKMLTVISAEGPDDIELLLEPNDNPAAKTYQKAIFEQGISPAAFAVEDIKKEGYSPKTATCERMVAWDGRLGALDVNTPRAGAFGEVGVVVQPATTSGCPGRCRFGCRQGSGGDCCAGSSWGRVPR